MCSCLELRHHLGSAISCEPFKGILANQRLPERHRGCEVVNREVKLNLSDNGPSLRVPSNFGRDTSPISCTSIATDCSYYS